MAKRIYNVKISKQLFDLAEFLREREEVTRLVFTRKAIRHYMEEKKDVDERILITKRSHPDYIERGTLYSVSMDEEQRIRLEEVAKEKGCKTSQLFFFILLEYCAFLYSTDKTGIEIE